MDLLVDGSKFAACMQMLSAYIKDSNVGDLKEPHMLIVGNILYEQTKHGNVGK